MSLRSLTNWLAQGKVVRRRRADVLDLTTAAPTTTGLDRLRQAEDGLLTVVVKAAQRGSWPAAMRLLAVIRPEVYGNRPVAPTERPKAPTTEAERERLQVFAEIDELAARRAQR